MQTLTGSFSLKITAPASEVRPRPWPRPRLCSPSP